MRDNDLMSWYTVYNAKTDEIVACGTADMIVRLLLLTLATAETVVDCLIPNLPDKKVREAADCFADDMKAVIISAYEDKASDHKSKLTSKEAAFLSKLMGL